MKTFVYVFENENVPLHNDESKLYKTSLNLSISCINIS